MLAEEEGLATSGLGKLTGILSKESVLRLHMAAQSSATSAKEMALALRATLAGIDYSRLRPDIQLVWTGPETAEAKPRDTLPQMLEMIGKAQIEILLVTFAAFKAHAIMRALQEAHARGIVVTIVTESVENSAGQLTHDAWKAFPAILLQTGCLWYWPIAKRTVNAKGMPGKLHAKCLVIDGCEALVSSANLTDDAMVRNIEIGLRCSSQAIAIEIQQKFQGLKKSGHLIPIKV